MTIFLAILLFSFLIFVHELGHFLAAKASGVKVNEFALFMGPAIIKKTVGETTYSLRCIPIGGFCAMEGEDADTDSPRSFQKAAWWKRFLILVAGAATNFVIGVILMVILVFPSDKLPMPVIESFESYSTVSGENGLQVGDKFLKIDGEKILLQSDIVTMLTFNDTPTHDLVIERNGQKIVLDDFPMEKHAVTDSNGQTVMLYGMNFMVDESPSFWEKVEYGWLRSVNCVREVILSLRMLVSGKIGFSDLGGPVMIVDQMSQAADSTERWSDKLLTMLSFGAFLSINLAVMNLLPLPALDGGRIVGLLLTTAIEGITRKKLNPKFEAYIHGIGMVLLLGLMAVIVFKDIFHIVKR